MGRKGFTLIELLAVIIILAVVALIATPIVLDVIEDARISTGRSEANIIYNGINNYCLNEEVEAQLNPNYTKICTTSMSKTDVANMVNLGSATIDELVYDGEKLTTLVITSNKHKFTLCPSGTFAMDDEECKIVPESLISLLLKQYDKSNTKGLVKDSTNENLYYYTGTNEEVTNNFLWYGGHQWRVLEFDTNENSITLISQQPLTTIQPSSAVWTTQEEYESSYINTWLNDYFWNSLDSSIQNNIKKTVFNIGIYTDVDEITIEQNIGLLDNDQYVRAGEENSFLDIKDYFWLGNRYNSSYVRTVYPQGNLGFNSVVYTRDVRPVIKISDLIITGGSGTLKDSYYTENKATNTNNVQVGEYLSVPYSGSDNACGNDNICTFRVVSKDDDSIKVILNGLLFETSSYGNTVTVSKEHTIYTKLIEFAKGISDTYQYTGNKVFYIGDYPFVSEEGQNFEDIKDEYIEASVGLPMAGELFCANDIDLSTSNVKTFVDINTIENPTITSHYWTMNRYDLSNVRSVEWDGSFNKYSNSISNGVRPVIFLKNNLNFNGGNGTAQFPYTLS